MNTNLVYYSVNTKIANYINNEFYNGIHYVWVAPYFDCKEYNPTSSNPKQIYQNLVNDLKNGKIDYHSANVLSNRIGIKKGAIARFKQGLISQKIKEEIIELSECVHPDSFEPLIYIIPSNLVKAKIVKPEFKLKAHPMSLEYIIEDLKTEEFDIIEL